MGQASTMLRVMRPGDHIPLRRDTAQRLLSRGQVAFLAALAAAMTAQALAMSWLALLATVVAALQLFYLAFVGLKIWLTLAGLRDSKPVRHPLPAKDQADLPVITVLLPIVREKRKVLEKLFRAVDEVHYRKDRLQVIALLEAHDAATVEIVEQMDLPYYVQVLVVPSVGPRTKPKACNVGLREARGEYCVIWDTEDRPEPKQLLKAVAAFRAAPDDVVCLQARLVFWNMSSNVVTRMYGVEYIAHFDYILRGMARLGLVPPLGGTSNIFKTAALREIAIPATELRRAGLDPDELPMVAAWDPWNVTEDADIAGWLARAGYRVEMIDSWTFEESPRNLIKAKNQRARWGKGYAQAGCVHTRRPLTTLRQMGPKNFLAYNLLMLGTPLSLMVNPIFWGMTIFYFTTRPAFIEELFPPAIFYIGGVTMVVGNFLLFYQLIMACIHRHEYDSVKYMVFAPAWWAFTSYSMWKGVLELVLPGMRFAWHVTEHGVEEDGSEEGAIERLEVAQTASAVGY
jgi:cellulose synthase/poly-beta-1,6-N-acetylglucosamine synthase-like glycosyltransferase